MSNTRITTGEVRLSFAHLFEPYANPGSGDEPKYSVTHGDGGKDSQGATGRP